LACQRIDNLATLLQECCSWFTLDWSKALNRLTVFTLILSAAFGRLAVAQAIDPRAGIPHLEKHGTATQLVVGNKPFLVLGGELHNSSSSSVEYMKSIWPRLAAMHLSNVLLPVAWETIEPREGQFDFRCVDGLLEGARANNLKLVVLWFGAWKNTYSSYAPAWITTDTQRFPRVQTSDGRGTERLSPFSTAARDANAHAFAELMRHLRAADGENHTVLMVQVENEVGVIPEAQDGRAGAANALYALGHLSAIGFSPFGIDDQGNTPLDLAGIADPSEHADGTAIASVYSVLSSLAPMILEKQGVSSMTAALMEGDAQRSARLSTGDSTATITRSGGASGVGARIAALLLQTGPEEFLVAGIGDAQITFSTDKPGPPIVGIESINEESFENGAWIPGKRLNGDENSQGRP
jgi:hypothetical protein